MRVGTDRRDDLGSPDRFVVYYGMADNRTAWRAWTCRMACRQGPSPTARNKRRDDLGSPDRFDVYYGMADDRIGVARLDLPEGLPTGALADSPEQKV